MKLIIILIAVFLCTGSILSISCKKERSCEGCATKNNKPPIAVAGPDQVITLPTDSVSLNGINSSDPDGTISVWLWTKISGPASFNIINPSDSTTKIKTLVIGIYQFELKVTDDGGLSAKDTMRVIVDAVVTTNHPPIANAGADQTITLPTNTINLDGSTSTDPENNIASYVWTKISGPTSINIVNSTAVQTQLTNLNQGIYQIELKVTDVLGLFSKDTMQVIVNAAVSNNRPPVAIAGNDTTIQTTQTSCTPVPLTITLNGANSYDPDGSVSSYLWIGPNGIANPNSAITTMTGVFQGTISIILKVTDNNGAAGYDTVRILIIPANRPLIQAQLIPVGTLSQSRFSFAAAAAGNKLVFAGGWIDNGNSSPSSTRVDIYDIATSNWTVAQLSEGRFAIGVAVLGNKIFFGGGGRQQDNGWGAWQYAGLGSSVVDILDVTNNSWSTALLSNPRVPVGASAGNQIVFAGGDDFYPSSRVDIYDGITNTWTSRSLSETKHISQIAVSGNKIFLAGGSAGLFGAGGNGVSKQIDILDASTGAWSVDLLSFERGEMGAIGANNKIYWGGGAIVSTQNSEYGITNSVEIKDLATNTTSFDCLSEPRLGCRAVRKDNKIIFFGGGLNGSTFDIYDLTTNSWSIGVLPQNLSWPTIISHNNTLYVAGGEINRVVSNQVWKLEF